MKESSFLCCSVDQLRKRTVWYLTKSSTYATLEHSSSKYAFVIKSYFRPHYQKTFYPFLARIKLFIPCENWYWSIERPPVTWWCPILSIPLLKNRTSLLRRSFRILSVTRMITDQVWLHSVLLPLLRKCSFRPNGPHGSQSKVCGIAWN